MYQFFIDTETVGTNALKHSLIQVAGSICKDGKELESFNYSCKPWPTDEICEDSLRFHAERGLSLEKIMSFEDSALIFSKFCSLLKKYINPFNKTQKAKLIGYNINFDEQFLRAWFSKCGNNYFGSFFWWPAVDVAGLAMEFIGEDRYKLPNFKLSTVANYFGIKTDETMLHDALYDIQLTRAVYDYIKAADNKNKQSDEVIVLDESMIPY